MVGKHLMLVTLFIVAGQAPAGERLSVLSPHRKSLQREYIPAFKKYYKKQFGQEIKVDWIDQGGTENDLRYIKNKFNSDPESSGIDVFWGGGDLTFQELDEKGYLLPVRLPKYLKNQLSEEVAGIRTVSKGRTWFATAISSFGIFYNRYLQEKLSLPAPGSWDSLALPAYRGHVSVADPRHSSSSLTMFLIMLYSDKWENSWKTISSLAGNVKEFTLSSSQPVKAVVSGDATFATAIDFYASAKIASLGKKRLGYILPPAKTVFNADPVGILKGAPNKIQAERFVAYLLDANAQQKLILAKGHTNGPLWSTLGRMAVNETAYKLAGDAALSQNPFQLPKPDFILDLAKMARVKSVLKDLIGAIYIDLHPLVRETWVRLNQDRATPQDRAAFWAPPLTEAGLDLLASKWNDQSLRNKTINEWVAQYKELYRKLSRSESVVEG